MPNGKSKYFFIPVLLGDVFILCMSFGIAYYFQADNSLNLSYFIFDFLIAITIWVSDLIFSTLDLVVIFLWLFPIIAILI